MVLDTSLFNQKFEEFLKETNLRHLDEKWLKEYWRGNYFSTVDDLTFNLKIKVGFEDEGETRPFLIDKYGKTNIGIFSEKKFAYKKLIKKIVYKIRDELKLN